MKIIIPAILALSTFFTASAQQMACCKLSATQEFAMLSNDEGFRSEHAEPKKYKYSEGIGNMMTFPTEDGEEARAFTIIHEETPTANFLFVMHEWWGLNDNIKKEAAKLYKELGNVNILALDLYDGKNADNQEDAAKLMNSANEKRIRSIIQGAIKLAGKEANIATVGWCFGGGWSLQATLMAGEQAAGCVMYYGMPETDVEKLKTLETDVVGIFASKDNWITPEVVEEFDKNMKAAGKKLDYLTFDAVHAFANPSNPNHNSEATAEAYGYVVRFLKQQFSE